MSRSDNGKGYIAVGVVEAEEETKGACLLLVRGLKAW